MMTAALAQLTMLLHASPAAAKSKFWQQ